MSDNMWHDDMTTDNKWQWITTSDNKGQRVTEVVILANFAFFEEERSLPLSTLKEEDIEEVLEENWLN